MNDESTDLDKCHEALDALTALYNQEVKRRQAAERDLASLRNASFDAIQATMILTSTQINTYGVRLERELEEVTAERDRLRTVLANQKGRPQ